MCRFQISILYISHPLSLPYQPSKKKQKINFQTKKTSNAVKCRADLSFADHQVLLDEREAGTSNKGFAESNLGKKIKIIWDKS